MLKRIFTWHWAWAGLAHDCAHSSSSQWDSFQDQKRPRPGSSGHLFCHRYSAAWSSSPLFHFFCTQNSPHPWDSGRLSDWEQRWRSSGRSWLTEKCLTNKNIAVFRIHDILVWIRIRIRGSMPLTDGSGFRFGSGSCYFRHWLSRRQQKSNLKNFLAYIYIILQR